MGLLLACYHITNRAGRRAEKARYVWERGILSSVIERERRSRYVTQRAGRVCVWDAKPAHVFDRPLASDYVRSPGKGQLVSVCDVTTLKGRTWPG